ncbi:MAG: cellulase family glycosylhydrolase [Rhodopila sp.]
MGGIGTQSAMIEYGPQGTTGQHVFTAGLAYDGATYNVDSATQKSALCGVPLTLVHGTADTTVSPSPDQQLAQTLSGCSGFNANWVQDATHGTWNNPDWKGYGASTLINQTMTQARSGSGTSSSVTQSAPSAVQPATSATATTSTANTQLRTSQNAQVSTAQSSQAIAPGQTFTDANGNVWAITPSGSITENGQYTPGGGGTSALTIVAGVVYGEDSSGKGWFALSGGGQYWTSAPAPSGITTTQAQGVGTTTTNTPSQGTSTQTVAIPPPSCGNVTGGQFGILPLKQGGTGQIIDSAGNVFAPRGINVMYGNGNPSAATLKSTFPGINFLRLAIYNYNSPQELAPYVDDLTSNGIVVELEDHNNNAGGAGGGQGVIFSGQTLTDESSWYASVASAFKSNPYVWFGTNNEPSTKSASGQTDAAALSQWQRATYDAIRATGNQSIIFLETACWTEGGKPVCNQGYDSSAYSGMSNVAWDNHVYGWLTNFNTDQATNDQFVSDNVTALASIKSAGNAIMPVVIGEYGNSTTGQAIDPNGTQVVNAVNKSVTNGGAAGSSAWAWGSGGPGDGLTNGGSGLSSYGQQVASAMTQATPTVSVCQGSASQVAQGTTPAGKASVALTQKAPAAGEQTDTAGTAPVLTAADPTADPTYIQAASGAATSAAQATSAAIAAGQARMKGN